MNRPRFDRGDEANDDAPVTTDDDEPLEALDTTLGALLRSFPGSTTLAEITTALGATSPDAGRWDQLVAGHEDHLERSPAPLLVTDEMGFIVRTNEKAAELVGVALADAIGEHVGRFIHPGDYDGLADLWVRMQIDTTFDAVSSESRVLTAGGYRWHRLALRAGRDDVGGLTSITVHMADLDDKYADTVDLDRGQRRFGDLLDSLPDPIVRVNTRFEPEFSNPAAHALWELHGSIGWGICTEDVRTRFQTVMGEVLSTEAPAAFEHPFGTGSEVTWHETTVIPEAAGDGRIRSLLLISRDITHRRLHETKLAHQANHDPLTGLPNRGYFARLLGRAIDRLHHASAAEPTSRLAVLFLDLDGFKVVNDSLGHPVGDQLLVLVAARLEQALRPGDVLGRLGGDEFTVFAHVEHAEDAYHLAERLLRRMRTPFVVEDRELLVGASIGVACTDRPADPSDLMRWADSAMYRAKQRGRNCVAVFDDELRHEALELLEIDQDLRAAVDLDQFRVRYQPEVCLETGAAVGAEALVRWEHPTRGLLQAGTFVPMAEENGTILAIGNWVLRTACDQVARWVEEGHVPPGFVLRVNLSARQLDDPMLVASVGRALRDSGLTPRSLCIEITETALMSDVDRAMVVLERLHALGVHLAVDDFGTGCSSLSSLKRFPLDVLKIDRSFIDGLPDDPHDRAITTTVLRLADALGLGVIAEGVENSAQRDALRALGCPTAQGHLFAPALDADGFVRALAGRRMLSTG